MRKFAQSGHPGGETKADETSVTRLGEFSPFGRLFSLGSYLKISEVAHNFGLLLSTE
jgi:hypothetical protein